MGSTGAGKSTVNALIKLWSTNPPQSVSPEEVADINASSYGLATNRLSAKYRNRLAEIVQGDVARGQSAHTAQTVQAIQDGKNVQLSLKGLSVPELQEVAKMAADIHTTASMFAFEDALKLIGYKSK